MPHARHSTLETLRRLSGHRVLYVLLRFPMADHLYKNYRIRLLSQLQQGVWYPEAPVLADLPPIGTPIYEISRLI